MRYVLILLILGQANLKAQSQIRTGPVFTTDKVSFRLSDAKSLQDARNTIVRLRVNSSTMSLPYTTLLPPGVCTTQGSNYECEYSLPQDIVTLLNVPGKHNLYSFVFDRYGESQASQPWTITTPSR